MACGLPCVDVRGGSSEAEFGARARRARRPGPRGARRRDRGLLDDEELWRRRSEAGVAFVADADWDTLPGRWSGPARGLRRREAVGGSARRGIARAARARRAARRDRDPRRELGAAGAALPDARRELARRVPPDLAEQGKLPGLAAGRRSQRSSSSPLDAANSEQTQAVLTTKPEWSAEAYARFRERDERLPGRPATTAAARTSRSRTRRSTTCSRAVPYRLASGGDLFARLTAARLGSVMLPARHRGGHLAARRHRLRPAPRPPARGGGDSGAAADGHVHLVVDHPGRAPVSTLDARASGSGRGS